MERRPSWVIHLDKHSVCQCGSVSRTTSTVHTNDLLTEVMWEVCKFPSVKKLTAALNTVVVAVLRPIGRSRFRIPALSLALAPCKFRD